jgi:antitoxin component of MazEF toxin-antitoxin module
MDVATIAQRLSIESDKTLTILIGNDQELLVKLNPWLTFATLDHAGHGESFSDLSLDTGSFQ